MAWTLDNTDMKLAKQLTPDEKKKFNAWAKKVADGTHPKTASEDWDSDYEVLKTVGKVKKCSIRLTEGNRVYFEQDDQNKAVKVLRAGDHKKPSGF